LALELLDAATAAARALLLKNEEAIIIRRPGLEGESVPKLVDVLKISPDALHNQDASPRDTRST
jgi:hypothetical protein